MRGIHRSQVTGEFPAQQSVTWSFDVFFDLRLNKQLTKQSWSWYLRRHRAHYDVTVTVLITFSSAGRDHPAETISFYSMATLCLLGPGHSSRRSTASRNIPASSATRLCIRQLKITYASVYLHIHDIHKSTQYNFEIHEIGSPLTTSCTLGLTCRLYMFNDMKLIMTWSIFRINTLMSKFWHFFPDLLGHCGDARSSPVMPMSSSHHKYLYLIKSSQILSLFHLSISVHLSSYIRGVAGRRQRGPGLNFKMSKMWKLPRRK